MVRSVQVDAAIQEFADSCVQARAIAQVGTLVGRRTSSGKVLLLQTLQTPDNNGVAPVTLTSTSGGGERDSNKSGLLLDVELIVEHAAMVERMLPGGLDVMGFYVLCPTTDFAGGAPGLLTMLLEQAVSEVGTQMSAMLLLHIDSVSGALALREAATGGNWGLCELKLAGLRDQMVQLQCRYDICLQLPAMSARQELHMSLQLAADVAARRIQGAVGFVGDHFPGSGYGVTDLPDDVRGVIPVELLLHPNSSLGQSSAGGGKTQNQLQHGSRESHTWGLISLVACLDCRACVDRREEAPAAVLALRCDVKRSLQARMDAMLEFAERRQESAAAGAQHGKQCGNSTLREGPPALPAVEPLFMAMPWCRKPLVVNLPRRVFLTIPPWISFCDYLFGGQSSLALRRRLEMLLVMPGLSKAVVECLELAVARPAGWGSGLCRKFHRTSISTLQLPPTVLLSILVVVLALFFSYLALKPGN